MARRFLAAVALSCLLAGAAGCARVHLDLVADEPPACLNDPVAVDLAVLRHFRREARAHFGLFGLVTWKDLPLAEVVREEVAAAGGDAVINLTVTGRQGLWEILLGLPLSPLWTARSYVVEGDVVLLPARK
ncbi:hypothetical protein G3N55_03030 [Dissulfurirhabdus thermomarina]|uniref:Lipoprotein n=1 Tax=Dissulfurirhabdus thermomarina TaxID=1765737 RepID=A0A6N9TL91_DISTH|nr:hypothetical protein [Dissulfurirhabdus thermomarina]NDY41828.1 hypothetical protein [Dissulfurirhabdus thermomarina]NMX22471.1 hypothetical protein [Dissulfurirhabdus thermomarina]